MTVSRLAAAAVMTFAIGAAAAASAAGPPPAAKPLAGEAPAAVRARFAAMIEARNQRMLANALAGRATPRTDIEPGYFAISEAGELGFKADDGSDFVGAAEAQVAMSVDDLHVRLYGDTAVATYRLNISLRFNGEPCLKPFRITEVFHRTGKAWRAVAYQETVIPGRPTWSAKVDPKLLDAYAGQYRILPSVTYNMVRRGEKLYWGEDTELFPETDSSFATENAADYRLIFLRDEAGKVSGVRIRELSGVEYTAVRVAGSGQ